MDKIKIKKKKVFFIAESETDSLTKKTYKEIIRILNSLHCNVEERIFSRLIRGSLKSTKDFEKIYRDTLRNIEDSEVVVAEISSKSGGVGYQIYHAISNKIPVVALYEQNKARIASTIIRGSDNKYLLVFSYNSGNLKKVIEKALQKAKELRRVRFNLVITNTEYIALEKKAKKERINKTELIRRLLREYLNLD
ncbi:MAG: ribbon-helix-helix protein, CopG family [bacterium]|nr:ribbon-helix-helix protein, CopG family [bacterium]